MTTFEAIYLMLTGGFLLISYTNMVLSIKKK